MARPEFDLCIIGGGSGGLTVAAGAAALGAKTVLVEKHRLGGECLWSGCVPSKALIHVAKVAHTVRHAARAGVAVQPPRVSVPAAMERVWQVIHQIEHHDRPERFRGMGIDVVFGVGHFTDPDGFQVGERVIRARKYVLATGSRPAVPPIPGLADLPYLTNETVWNLREEVPHLLVIGAGPIGLELAQCFARLGSKVDVVDLAPAVLPREDAELAGLVQECLAGEGVGFHLGVRVEQADGAAGAVRLQIAPPNAAPYPLEGSHLLVATGRIANTDGLGLDAAGVRVEQGRPLLNRGLRTTNRRIYACGDVAGPYLFSHMAEHQGGVVLKGALFGLPAKTETRAVPWATFTDPELARVGLSEAEARAQGIACQVYEYSFAASDRAVADDAAYGKVKVVADMKARVLGATILGPAAGELIHEYVLAVSKRMRLGDVVGAIHVYPTLSQANRGAALGYLRGKMTPFTRMLMHRLFGLRGPAVPLATEEPTDAH